MNDYHCHNCGITLDYNNAFGWVLYVEGPRRVVYLNYCPNCGTRLDKTPDKKEPAGAGKEDCERLA